MNTRSAFTTQLCLICAVTSLILLGPASLQAQTGRRSNPPAAQEKEAKNTQTTGKTPFFQAVKQGITKLLAPSKSKTSKRGKRVKSTRRTSQSRQQSQSTQGRPEVLPFLQPSKTDVSNSQNREQSVRSVIRQVRQTTTAVPQPPVANSDRRQRPTSIVNVFQPQSDSAGRKTLTTKNTVQQTAAAQKTTARRSRQTQSPKTGLLTRFLGRDKRSTKQRQSSRQARVSPKPVRPSAFSNIPRLLPKFLQPKSLPRTVSTPATTRRPTKSIARTSTAARTSAAISLNSTTTRTTQPTDFEDPFTEVSELEADGKKANPFTGLKLESEKQVEESVVSKTTGDDSDATQKSTTPKTGDQTTTVAETTDDDALETKLQQLAERAELSGLQGFCPVMLRDHRELADTDPEFTTTYNEQTFQFSSGEAKAKFDAEPAKYAPVKNGHDVIVLTEGQVELEGSLENAVWFKDRLYLFSSHDTLETFIQNPVKYTADSDSDESKPAEEKTTEEAEEETTTEENESTEEQTTEGDAEEEVMDDAKEEVKEDAEPDVSSDDEIGFE